MNHCFAGQDLFENPTLQFQRNTQYFALHEERHMIHGTLPYAKITILNPDASMVTGVVSGTRRLVGSPVKSQRKVAEKDQWLCWLGLFNWVVCPMTAPEEVCSGWKWQIRIESHSEVLEDHDASRKDSGKEGSIAGNRSKMRTWGASFRGLPKFEERTQN